jgi:glycosyltransferase involved in cell wall biosynthesis
MKIGILVPSIYMSPTNFADMIFAVRDLAISLADGLVRRGHDVYLFTAPDIKTKANLVGGSAGLIGDEYVLEKMREIGGPRFIWSSYYGRKNIYEADLTAKCFQMVKEGKLDVVHSYHDQLAHFFEEATGAATVYTLHDPLPIKPHDLTYWLYKKYHGHNFVSISDAFRRHDSLKLNFVDTVYHGLDFRSMPYRQAPSDYLLFMGRMVPEKGLHLAIAAALATKISLEIGTHFPNEHEKNPYFDTEINPHLSNPLIIEPGMVTSHKKMALYGGAKALLFPIVWEEPFGMVLVEAMACGTPVIAYNRGSVAEIVEDGVTGFIVDSDDTDRPGKGTWKIKKQGVAGLVEAIKRIGEIDRPACRKHVEEKFTIEKMVEGYEKIYQKILSQQST